MISNININDVTPRLFTGDSCRHCHQSMMLISSGRQRCLNCGAWLNEDRDIATFYVVARTLNILLDHDFKAGNFVQEHVFANKQLVGQQRIEFHFPNSARNIVCHFRWFPLPEPCAYRYQNKTSPKVLDNRQVPDVVQAVASKLSMANTFPGSLRLMDTNVDSDHQGRKFICLEQSYAHPDDSSGGRQASVCLHVTLSWNTAAPNS